MRCRRISVTFFPGNILYIRYMLIPTYVYWLISLKRQYQSLCDIVFAKSHKWYLGHQWPFGVGICICRSLSRTDNVDWGDDGEEIGGQNYLFDWSLVDEVMQWIEGKIYSFFFSLGTIFTYFAVKQNIWWVMITYGVIFGGGSGIVYSVAIAAAMKVD